MFVPYLIATNAVLLTLSVIATVMLNDGPETQTGLGAMSITIGIGTGQACILGTYLACSYKPFGIRLRWFTRLLVLQWCCFVFPLVAKYSPNDLHSPFPWCLLIDQLLIAIAAFLTVGALRLISSRAVLKIADGVASKTRSNLRILDLLILISLIAVFLSIAMRFKNQPSGFGGLIYAAMVGGGVFVGSPTGAVLPFFFLGYLTESKKTIVISALVAIIALLVGLGPFLYYTDTKSRIGTLLFSLAGLGLVIANTFALRLLCYRLIKLPRTQDAAGTHDVTPIITEEPSHA